MNPLIQREAILDSWIGKTLSKVQIEKVIGRGGMAEVYVGRHATLNRPMAVKLLHAHMTEDPQLRERFEAEAQAVASLRHPNIVQVSDFDVIDGRPYIIMELLEGMSLAKYLMGLHGSGSSLPMQAIVRIMRSVGSALDYAHQRGIVHRDVKPANIVLRQGSTAINSRAPLADDVEPILTDFGVARIANAATRTVSGTILGTPAYMSPEQVQGQRVDARSDIYSLGIILYELLAGKLPFNPDTDTPASILYKHVHEQPPKLANTHPSIQAVVDRAMAKNKDQRYQKAGQLARDLASTIDDPAATTVRPPSRTPAAATKPADSVVPASRSQMAGTGTASEIKKKRFPFAAVAALVVVGVGIIAGGLFAVSQLLENFSLGPLAESAPPAAETLPVATIGQVVTTDALSTDQAGHVVATGSGSAMLRFGSIEGTIRGLQAPPDGQTYHLWLTSSKGEVRNITEASEFASDSLTFSFAPTEGGALLANYDGLIVSLEATGNVPVAPTSIQLEGHLPEGTINRVLLLRDVHPSNNVLAEFSDLLDRQAVHYRSHINNALNSIAGESLSGSKQHSEHVINIIEGRDGELYSDWDDNGRTENPGDDVGLLSYLILLQAASSSLNEHQTFLGGSDASAAQIAEECERLTQLVILARNTAKEITLADSMNVVLELELNSDFEDALAVRDQIGALASSANALDLAFAISIQAPEA
jgi:serine/threonine-protein kinase